MPKACKNLLDQVLCHINFEGVLTEKWLQSSSSVDSACAVVRDHFKETDTVVSCAAIIEMIPQGWQN